jgi:glycosyltransferase involved in cell wall biosynthesis
MKNLTLIIPAKNESESLPDVINELGTLTCQRKVILKEDDILTIDSIKDLNTEIIYQNEYGYGDALITGINNVNTEYFCIFNADGSFDPKEIPSFIKMLENQKKDFVFGSRYEKNSGSDDDTIVTYIGNKIFTTLGRLFFNLPITDILYTFVLGKTKKAKELNLKQSDFSFCVELPIKAKKNNMQLGSVACYERKRIAGKKKVNAFKDGLIILTHMIKLFFK